MADTDKLDTDRPNTEKKRGKLSMGERATITELSEKGWTVEAIAQKINRTTEPIIRFIGDNYLTHQGMSNHEQDRILALERLRGKMYYKHVKQCFTIDELLLYEEYVVDYFMQFNNDVLASEEQMIHNFAELNVTAFHNRKEKHKHLLMVESDEQKYEADLADAQNGVPGAKSMEMLDLETHRIEGMKSSANSFDTSYNKLVDQQQNISKNLKADRATRIKHIESSKQSFAGYIRDLQDEKAREKEGRDAELHKLAKEKAMVDFGQYHEYGDGTIDRPFLNDRTVMLDDETS